MTVTQLKLNRWKVAFTDTAHKLVVCQVIHITLAITNRFISLCCKVFILFHPAIVRLSTETSLLARKAHVTRFTQTLERLLLLFQDPLLYPLLALVHYQLVSASEQR